MRTLTFDRKTAKLTEKQVKQLIAYLDPKDVERSAHYFYIRRYSPLCGIDTMYDTPHCDECPIGTGIRDHACVRIARNFSKDTDSSDYRVFYDTDEIYWRLEHDKGARNALERIRQRLRELPRT